MSLWEGFDRNLSIGFSQYSNYISNKDSVIFKSTNSIPDKVILNRDYNFKKGKIYSIINNIKKDSLLTRIPR
ncbi:hypothetical protein D1818_00025 [Aquimarina sp. BL5]|nr:hypothetical protein D1818_00025 [Aquimarina sp. BL5]